MPHTSSSPLPPPPAGYRPAERFHYPKLALQVAAIAVLLLAAPLLLILTGFLQNWLASRIAFASGPRDFILVVLVVAVTVVVHELVHGLAYQLFGYRVTYG